METVDSNQSVPLSKKSDLKTYYSVAELDNLLNVVRRQKNELKHIRRSFEDKSN